VEIRPGLLHRVPTKLKTAMILERSPNLDLCNVPMFAKELPKSGLIRFWG